MRFLIFLLGMAKPRRGDVKRSKIKMKMKIKSMNRIKSKSKRKIRIYWCENLGAQGHFARPLVGFQTHDQPERIPA